MLEGIQIWAFLAGLGLFLFGMFLMEEALRKLAGRSFKRFLRKHTSRTAKAILSGALTTAVLQSSSLVVLLVMSFTSAGIIGLQNGIGIILGANLGTTFTGWMVSLVGFKLNFQELVLPVIAIGGLGLIFLKAERPASFSKFLMGFGFLFMGLGYMRDGLMQAAESYNLETLAYQPHALYLLIGFLLTAAIQSSSASVAIYLSAIASGIISPIQGGYLVIGSDLGTTVTAMLGTLRANSVKRKTGWAQVWINVITASTALLLLRPMFFVIRDLLGIHDPLMQLVLFHSVFNLTGILLLAPFLGLFTRMINRFIKDDHSAHTQYLFRTNPAEVVSALEALTKETQLYCAQACLVIRGLWQPDDKRIAKTTPDYAGLKAFENEIMHFSLRVQQEPLNAYEAATLSQLSAGIRRMAIAVKDIKDVSHNLKQLRAGASDELYALWKFLSAEQASYWESVEKLIENLNEISSEPLSLLNAMQEQLHERYHREAHRLLDRMDTDKEMDYSSLMNLIHAICNSNKSLLDALAHLSLAPKN